MKIFKMTLVILVGLSLTELIYYFVLANPLKSVINQEKSSSKKGIASGDSNDVLLGDIVDYFRRKKINAGISYVLEEKIEGYLTKAKINEENGKKFISIIISTDLDNRTILNAFGKNLDNAGNLFFRLTESGQKQLIEPSQVKAGVRVKQISRRNLPEADPLNDTLEIQILE